MKIIQNKPPSSFITSIHCRHKLTEHEGVRYSCDLCPAIFSASTNLKRHKLSKHEGVNQELYCLHYRRASMPLQCFIFQKKWECDQCPSTFTDQGNLRRHKLTKHEGATYDCYACHKQFGNHGTLKRHVQSQHEGVR